MNTSMSKNLCDVTKCSYAVQRFSNITVAARQQPAQARDLNPVEDLWNVMDFIVMRPTVWNLEVSMDWMDWWIDPSTAGTLLNLESRVNFSLHRSYILVDAIMFFTLIAKKYQQNQ